MKTCANYEKKSSKIKKSHMQMIFLNSPKNHKVLFLEFEISGHRE
jgi:hypothetical protein